MVDHTGSIQDEGLLMGTFQTWGEYWTKVLQYKYFDKSRVKVYVQVLDFLRYSSTSTSSFEKCSSKSTEYLYFN